MHFRKPLNQQRHSKTANTQEKDSIHKSEEAGEGDRTAREVRRV